MLGEAKTHETSVHAYLHNDLDPIPVNFHHPVSIYVVKISPVDGEVIGVVEHVSHNDEAMVMWRVRWR